MSLVAGRLGPYEIVAPIGAGGMGEVYRARDTRLDRTVALKILPVPFASDTDRLARFEREAKTLAALNHPHIAQIYSVELLGDTHAIVMELVEGEDLSALLARGPLPIDEALAIGRQIAVALEAAHDQGIVHRDLKPANIRLATDGAVKVLDFGLGKALESQHGSGDALPTITSPAMTVAGIILGTAAYMSPEQARGKLVDRRADIWAFGCVLYEMLTGRRAFPGESITEVLAKVIEREPDWSALPHGTPASVRLVLGRCLRKDPAKRLHHIADVRLELDDAFSDAHAVESHADGRGWRRWQLPAAAALVAAAAAVAITFGALRAAAVPGATPVLRFTVPIPPNTAFLAGPALSPDGRYIAQTLIDQTGRAGVWIRELAGEAFKQLPGTEGAYYAFWSPDSSQLALVTPGKLRRIRRDGTGATEIATLTGAAALVSGSGAWDVGGDILFGSLSSPIFRVPASGGVATPVTTLAPGEMEHRSPRLLPEGGRFVYLALAGVDGGGVFLQSLSGGPATRVIDTRGIPHVAPGAILVAQGRGNRATLTAYPFESTTGVVRGNGVALAVDVFPIFSASETGVLAYRTAQGSDQQLVWVDANGTTIGKAVVTGSGLGEFNLSRDERFIALTQDANILIHDLSRGVSSRMTDDRRYSEPIFSPDGRRLAYSFNEAAGFGIAIRPAAGGADEIVLRSKYPTYPEDWSSDGRFLSAHENTGTRHRGFILPLPGAREPIVFADLAVGATIDEHRFSPDGRWLAYNATEGGRPDVYLVPVPPTGERWQVSVAGGAQPRWRGDGAALYYLSVSGQLMMVDVRTASGAPPQIGRPRALFDTGLVLTANLDQYAPSADGKRFLVRRPVDFAGSSELQVIVNWPALLK